MSTDNSFEVLVVGAGPAGIAAACAAAECGVRVGVVDDNPAPGGQIWRNEANPAIERLRSSGAAVFNQTIVFDAPSPGVLLADSNGSLRRLAYRRLVLATGAREIWLPFPGWTLPNVLGAGGLQALVKGGLPISGKRVVVIGSGPLLLAVAAYVKRKGGHVLLVGEQASLRSVISFGKSLLAQPAKVLQAASLRWSLKDVEYANCCWPTEAKGENRLESVIVSHDGRVREFECDYLGCGFGLRPNTELPELLGCALKEGHAVVDELQRTSVDGVYCAGEASGIGGSDLAELEGAVAGFSAGGQESRSRALFSRRRKAQSFADSLNRAFRLREELKALPRQDTIVCRCEDVTWGRLQTQANWRAAKLLVRCGMGPCQGRVCGSAVEFLTGWPRTSIRAPLYPVPARHFAEDP